MIQKDLKVCIPQAQPIDNLATTSIKNFVIKFGLTTTMLIYDSLLAGKRILFSGDTKQNSIEEV